MNGKAVRSFKVPFFTKIFVSIKGVFFFPGLLLQTKWASQVVKGHHFEVLASLTNHTKVTLTFQE